MLEEHHCIICLKEMNTEQIRLVCSDECSDKFVKLLRKHNEEYRGKFDAMKTFEIDEVLDNTKCIVSGKSLDCSEMIKYGKEARKEDNDIENRKVLEGGPTNRFITGIISAPYGSKYDGSYFYLAISDDEIQKLIEEGRIHRVGRYF